MAQSNEEVLDGYLRKGGIYLEIYYLLLKLSKPAQGRYRLKLMLDEVFVAASSICNEIFKLNHPEANFDRIWYNTKNNYKRYETDLIFSVVYTLLKCIPVKGKNFIAVLVEIEEKNEKDTTYFPYFKELAENWLKGQGQQTSSAPSSQVETLLKQIESLQKENESLRLRNADLEEKAKDRDFLEHVNQNLKLSIDAMIPDERQGDVMYSFDELIAYAKSRQSYANSEQILTMLSKLLRNEGSDELWEKLDEAEKYLLNRDGGSINIEKNYGSIVSNENGGFVLTLSSSEDKQKIIELMKANNIKLIEE